MACILIMRGVPGSQIRGVDAVRSGPTARTGYWLAIAGLTAIFLARFPAIWFGYPFGRYVDEPLLVEPAYRIALTGDLHPGTFLYPSLMYYLPAAVFRIAAALGVPEVLPPRPIPDHFVMARGLSLLMAAAAVPVTAEIGRRLLHPLAGFAAACFLVAAPLLTSYSYVATVNPAMALFGALTGWMAALLLTRGPRLRYYVLAALFAGLAIGSKYVMVFAPLCVVLAHFLHRGPDDRPNGRLALFLLLVPLVFLATTPYVLVDRAAFLDALSRLDEEYRAGGIWRFNESASSVSYLAIARRMALEKYGLLPLALAGIGAAWLLRARWRTAAILLVAPTLTYLMQGAYKVYFTRHLMGALPFLAVLSGCGVWAVYASAQALVSGRAGTWTRGLPRIAAALALAAALWQPALASRDMIRIARLPTTQQAAYDWVLENVPPGSGIVREYNTPAIEAYTDAFEVTHVRSLVVPGAGIDVSGFDYAMGGWGYLRVSERDDLAAERAAYEAFFEANERVADFTPDERELTGPAIWVYRIAP